MSPWIAVAVWIALGVAGAYYARFKGRSPVAWFFWGALLGWFGLLILMILPPLQEGEEPLPLTPPRPVLPNPYENTSGWFFIDQTKAVCGPYTANVLREKWAKGELLPNSWVWNDLLTEWKKISTVQPLIDWFQEVEQMEVSKE